LWYEPGHWYEIMERPGPRCRNRDLVAADSFRCSPAISIWSRHSRGHSQRRHDRRTANVRDQDIARIHRQATNVTRRWLSSGWHPALTERWQRRHHRLAAAIPGPEAVLTDVITHPEMLAVARLLITSQHTPGIRPPDIADRLGFPYPSRPHPLDPLQEHLSP
jgi:hypothetical protein